MQVQTSREEGQSESGFLEKTWSCCVAGRSIPSVACIVQPGSSGGFQKLFFGSEEIAIPVYGR